MKIANLDLGLSSVICEFYKFNLTTNLLSVMNNELMETPPKAAGLTESNAPGKNHILNVNDST